MASIRAVLVWVGLLLVISIPIAAAARSPLLAWREPIYVIAGFAGVAGFALLLLQPLLIRGALPGLRGRHGRAVHRLVGIGLVTAVLVHVAGLWITSPPDVVDALLFVSPTPFSVWGVAAMWAILAAGAMAAMRRRLRIRPKLWRRVHVSLVVVIVMGTVIHVVLIEGTMETFSKLVLCGFVVAATGLLLLELRGRRKSAH